MLSDDRLASRGAGGDRRALEAIFRRYRGALYRFCLAMVDDREDAQDALQNTMLKVVRALPGEERRIELKPWLYRIARNESIETLRRRRENAELRPEQPAISPGLADTAASRERLQVLFGDLEQLPERQRAALVMRELSGLEFEQIGAAFGTSAAVARQTLYEARRSLRQMEEGREMGCDIVRREFSDADGRVTRRRQLRAHLRDCPGCRAFRNAIEERQRDFAAIVPLPPAASAGLLHGVAGGSQASAAVAGSALAKSAATVAIVAMVGVTVADRGGLVDLPVPGTNEPARAPAGGPADRSHGDVDSHAPLGSAGAAKRTDGRDMSTGGRGHGPVVATDRVETRPAEAGGQEPVAHATPETGGPAGSGAVRSGGAGKSERAAGLTSGPSGTASNPPAAANHGQETAAAHKPDHAGNPPGQQGSPGRAVGKPAGVGNGKGNGGSEEP